MYGQVLWLYVINSKVNIKLCAVRFPMESIVIRKEIKREEKDGIAKAMITPFGAKIQPFRTL